MTIYGWAFGIIDSRINPAGVARPRVRFDDAVVHFDDRVKIRDSPRIHASSVHGDDAPFVVWIADRAAVYGGNGYTVEYMARARTFGGMAHHDTLDEALADYDDIRGAKSEQLALFGGAA